MKVELLNRNTDTASLVRFLEEMEAQGNVEREGRLFTSDDD